MCLDLATLGFREHAPLWFGIPTCIYFMQLCKKEFVWVCSPLVSLDGCTLRVFLSWSVTTVGINLYMWGASSFSSSCWLDSVCNSKGYRVQSHHFKRFMKLSITLRYNFSFLLVSELNILYKLKFPSMDLVVYWGIWIFFYGWMARME